YMAARPMPRGGERERIRLRFRDDPKQASGWSEWAEIPDERARGFARLGQLFRERGKWVAARIEYGKGYARAGPKWAVLADQYALALMMSGDDAGAERVLADALRHSPGYAALHVHLARVLLKRGDFAAARTQLVLANREDPFDPEIHAGLAKALTPLSDPTGASREERFARILSGQGPQHP
ncbi:MAG: tetratricopeptide repeat protein, partial [Anaeromyxobacteraceae bacterium]